MLATALRVSGFHECKYLSSYDTNVLMKIVINAIRSKTTYLMLGLRNMSLMRLLWPP